MVRHSGKVSDNFYDRHQSRLGLNSLYLVQDPIVRPNFYLLDWLSFNHHVARNVIVQQKLASIK